MEDATSKALFAAAALFALAYPIFALASDARPEPAPRFQKILYSAGVDGLKPGLEFELGTVNRQEFGRSRIMATISSPRGVQAVCERVLRNGLPADPDSVPMTCTGSLFSPATRPAAVTFYFANSLRVPVLRFTSASGAAREIALNELPERAQPELDTRRPPSKVASQR